MVKNLTGRSTTLHTNHTRDAIHARKVGTMGSLAYCGDSPALHDRTMLGPRTCFLFPSCHTPPPSPSSGGVRGLKGSSHPSLLRRSHHFGLADWISTPLLSQLPSTELSQLLCVYSHLTLSTVGIRYLNKKPEASGGEPASSPTFWCQSDHTGGTKLGNCLENVYLIVFCPRKVRRMITRKRRG